MNWYDWYILEYAYYMFSFVFWKKIAKLGPKLQLSKTRRKIAQDRFATAIGDQVESLRFLNPWAWQVFFEKKLFFFAFFWMVQKKV